MVLERLSHAGAAPATGLTGSITSSTTSFSILSGTGYPTGSGGPFICVIDQGTASEEKILVASISSNTVTVSGGVAGRGYDNTVAASHNAGSTNFEHVFGAVEADDDNSHIYTTSRDDHTQYALVDGARGSVAQYYNGSTQALTAGTAAVVTFNTLVAESLSGYNTSTYTFTAPYTAWYRVTAQVQAPATSGSDLSLAVYHNGSIAVILQGSNTDVFSGDEIVGGSALVDCTAADTLTVYAKSAVNITLNNNANASLVTYELVN